MRKALVSILLLVIITHTGLARDYDSTNVLFIGNSYTYYHSMPQLFKAMAEHYFPGVGINVKFVGRGGVTLQQLWKEGEALEEIRSGRWDYVILQEQSMLGDEIIEDGKSYVQRPDQFFEYGGKFAREIKRSGSQAVFFMTWSRKEYPQQQKYLTYAYMHIAEKTGSKIAPVGMIWGDLRTETGITLHERDGSHPSVYGSYAAALTLFSVIFDKDPIDIPGRLYGFKIQRGGNISDEKNMLCDLSKHEAIVIQKAVSHIFHQLKSANSYLNVERAISDKKPSQFSNVVTYISDSKNQFLILMIITGIILAVKGVLLCFKR